MLKKVIHNKERGKFEPYTERAEELARKDLADLWGAQDAYLQDAWKLKVQKLLKEKPYLQDALSLLNKLGNDLTPGAPAAQAFQELQVMLLRELPKVFNFEGGYFFVIDSAKKVRKEFCFPLPPTGKLDKHFLEKTYKELAARRIARQQTAPYVAILKRSGDALVLPFSLPEQGVIYGFLVLVASTSSYSPQDMEKAGYLNQMLFTLVGRSLLHWDVKK